MIPFLLAAALSFSPVDAQLAYDEAKELVTNHTPRDAGTIRGKLAANHILDVASAIGANVRRDAFRADTPNGAMDFTNLYAELNGAKNDDRWVVVVSHYDTKRGVATPGANDGASTSALLIALARAYINWKDSKGNLLLVWTDGEECINSYGENDGFWGSRRAVEYLQSKDRKVMAVICIDMLGDRDLDIMIPSNVTPELASIAMHAARRAGCQDVIRRSEFTVKDDHMAFLEKGYNSIVLIDFNYGPNNAYWHTAEDTIDKISEASLLKSGKILAELLNILL